MKVKYSMGNDKGSMDTYHRKGNNKAISDSKMAFPSSSHDNSEGTTPSSAKKRKATTATSKSEKKGAGSGSIVNDKDLHESLRVANQRQQMIQRHQELSMQGGVREAALQQELDRQRYLDSLTMGEVAASGNRNIFASQLGNPGLCGHSLLTQPLQDPLLTNAQVSQYLQLQALNRMQQQQQQLQQQNFGNMFPSTSALGLARSLGGYDLSQGCMAPFGNPFGSADPSLAAAAALGYGTLGQNLINPQLLQGNGLPMQMGGPAIQDRSGSFLNGQNISSLGRELNLEANIPSSGIPASLPCILARPDDSLKLSSHQVLLRHQIEAFQATEDDISTHTRGRNKPITRGQVGIRCRHCAYLPVARRQKGSTYFPATTQGIYQAAQNMSTTHMQCGLCSEMPDSIKQEFARLLSTKVASSGAGRPYWAKTAKQMGLVDTENGIRFIRDFKLGNIMLNEDSSSKLKL